MPTLNLTLALTLTLVLPLEDYNIEVPYEMVPRSCVRPPNLKSQLNEVQKRRAQYKEEVKKGREKIEGRTPRAQQNYDGPTKPQS